MLERHRDAFFPGALVFPGGRVAGAAVGLVHRAAGEDERAREKCIAMALDHQHFEPGGAVAQQQQGRGGTRDDRVRS